MISRRDFHRRIAGAAAAGLGISTVAGCGKPEGGEKDKAKGKDGVGGEARTLNLFTWTKYTPKEMVESFQKAHNCTVKEINFDENEALLLKLRAKQEIYDVVVPSDYMVARLAKEKLIAPLDRAKLPNLKNLDARYVGLYYDEKNEFSVPYATQLTGVGFLKSKMTDGAPDGWAALFGGKFPKRTLMLDDMRECFGAALKFLGQGAGGWSLNSADPAQIKQAFELLKKQKPEVRGYDSSNFDDDLAKGDASYVVHAYAGQIARKMVDHADIGFVFPKEGTSWSVDNLCIPANARHPDLALAFLNHVLEPKWGAAITNVTGYTTVNKEGAALVDAVRKNSPVVFPDAETLKRGEMIRDLAPDVRKIYEGYWERIKGG